MVRTVCLLTAWALLITLCVATQNPNMITTQMEINGIKYDAICDCGKEVTTEIKSISEVKCTPTKIKIRQDKQGKRSTDNNVNLNKIQDLIGKPKDTTFVDPHTSSFK